MRLKDADGMVISVDPDQTAPEEQSDLGLHILRKLPASVFRIFHVYTNLS